MLSLKQNNRFKKDYKLMERRGKDMAKLRQVINFLQSQETQALLTSFKDHPLKGYYHGFRECHIEPDWLLIYKTQGNDLLLVRTGAHTDLFE